MTKRLAALAAVLFITSTAFAQQASLRVFLTDPGYVWSRASGNSGYTGAWGIGAEYWFTPRVSAAVDVSQYRLWVTTFAPDTNGALFPTTERKSERPVDAVLRYRFAGNERWKPYLGAGVRGVHTYAYGSLAAPASGRWNYSAEVNGGVTFMINKKLGLDFDGKHVFNETRYTGIDRTRGSFGFSWHF